MSTRRNFMAALGLVASVGFAGFGGAASAQDPLNWSVHVDLTGPAAYGGIPQGQGFKDYVAWKNSQGGIRGRMINLQVDDSTFKVDLAAANFKKALAAGPVHYMFGDSTAMIQAISPENNESSKVLMGSGSFATELADPVNYPFHFVAGATYGDQLMLEINYIAQTMDPKDIRLAIMHSSIALGRDGIEPAKARAAALGIEVVLELQTNFVETDVSAFALAIREAKPTHVMTHGYSFAVWPEVIRLVRDMGMNDVVFMTSMWQNEYEKVIELSDIAEGLIGIKVFNFDTNTDTGDMMALIRKIHLDRDPNFNGRIRLGYLDAWVHGMMAAQATEAVIDAGKEVNGPNLVAAMEAITDWDTGGIIGAPVSFASHSGGWGQVIRWEKKDGDWLAVPVSDWMKME